MKICLHSFHGMDFVLDRVLRSPRSNYELSEKEADITLMTALVQRGDSHAKYMRFLWVNYSITATLYFIGQKVIPDETEVMSESTMYDIRKKPLCKEDFVDDLPLIDSILQEIDKLQKQGDYTMASYLLPTGYLQTRHISSNYQALSHIYKDRYRHRLGEWKEFCGWVKTLPHSYLITKEKNNE